MHAVTCQNMPQLLLMRLSTFCIIIIIIPTATAIATATATASANATVFAT